MFRSAKLFALVTFYAALTVTWLARSSQTQAPPVPKLEAVTTPAKPSGGIVTFLTMAPPRPATPSPVFDRFCIAFLMVDWIVFGSLHFSMLDDTRRMLPGWVWFPDHVVIGTGIAEVTVGMLMLYGRTRRIAAIGSLVLLVLFIPAVFHILHEPGALPFAPDTLQARAWRLLGIPHNVLMAICSVHVLRKPYPDGLNGDLARPPYRARPDRVLPTIIVAFVLLLCNAAGFLTIVVGVHRDMPTATMWMMMCLAIGAVVGFLFAIPRANTKSTGGGMLRPNRNIEAISDWLTKILVGLGLVNFKDIGRFLTEQSQTLAPIVGVSSDFALALILYFVIAGFLEGYLLTRMFLQHNFEELQTARPSDGKALRTVPGSVRAP